MARGERPARAVAILAFALGFAAIGDCTARAETGLEAWERVEGIKQADGSAAARPASRAAVAAHPDFLPLVTQFTRIHTSRGGFAAAQAVEDSLRADATPHQARTAAVFLALERGAAQAALDSLALLATARAGSPLDAFRSLDVAIASLGVGQLDRAESLLVALEEHPAFSGDRFVSRFMPVFLRQPMAALELQRGNPETAIAVVAAASERAGREGWRDLRMRLLHLQGRCLAAAGNLSAAVAEYQRALDLAQDLDDDWQWATTSSWQAWALEQQRRYSEAFELRRRGLDLYPRMGDPFGMAYTLLGLGWDAIQVGRTQLAEDVLTRAVDFAREREWTWMEGQALMNLGVLYSELARFDRSSEALQQALELAEQSQNETQRTGILNNLAVLHLRMDRPDRALAIYEQLLSIHRANGNVEDEVGILNNMALAAENMGDTAQARTLYEHGLQLSIDHGLPNNATRINLGRLLGEYRLWDESERTLREAIEEARARGSTSGLANAQAELGRSLSLQDRMDEARFHLEAADSLRAATGLVALRVPGLIRLALVRFALERWQEGIAALDEAQALAARVAPPHVATTHCLRAFAWVALGETEKARAEARLAETTAQDASIRELAPYTAEIASIEAIAALLRSAPDAGAERNAIVEEAFAMLQRMQSRSLLECVQGGQRRIEPDVPDSLLQRERQARKAVDGIRRSIENARDPSNLDSLRVALAEAQAVQNQLRTLIFRSDRRYRDVATPPRLEPDALAAITGTSTLILDYVTGRECEARFPCDAFLFAVDADSTAAYPLGDTGNLNRQVRLLVDLLADPPRDDGEATELLLRELGETLLGPVAQRLHRYDTVLVVPDGRLARLPFAALRVPPSPSRPSRVHLVEAASIETVPSLAVLQELRREDDPRPEPNRRWDIAVWRARGTSPTKDSPGAPAFDLPHAEDELWAITSLLPRSTVLRAELQDEPELAAQLSQRPAWASSAILHFIAHGYFDDLQPWRSGLYLQPPLPGHEPRKLEIADVYGMDLRSRLVTLSACDTARGGTLEGMGFTGFTQALLASGVRSVLATLWSIDDASTPRFMASFYEGLGHGLSEATALRQAQLRFLAHDRLSHPYYWAPYVLLGDGSQRIAVTLRRSPPISRPAVLLALGAILLVAGSWMSWRARRL